MRDLRDNSPNIAEAFPLNVLPLAAEFFSLDGFVGRDHSFSKTSRGKLPTRLCSQIEEELPELGSAAWE